MTNAPRSYRAICFDLDGTLLPMDMDDFLAAYFKRIAAYMGEQGLDGAAFMAALKTGTEAMAHHDDERTNEEAFWSAFFPAYEAAAHEVLDEAARMRMHALADEFYDVDFPHVGDGVQLNPASARVVDALADKGYPLVLTTMPFFPRRAVEHRLAWAGVDPARFARITSYENSHSVKPKHAYYAENLAALGVTGEDVLMVGNNTLEDMAFLDLGADGYLVTDHLLDPVGFDLESVKHGRMADFEAWADALPACADPAQGLQ